MGNTRKGAATSKAAATSKSSLHLRPSERNSPPPRRMLPYNESGGSNLLRGPFIANTGPIQQRPPKSTRLLLVSRSNRQLDALAAQRNGAALLARAAVAPAEKVFASASQPNLLSLNLQRPQTAPTGAADAAAPAPSAAGAPAPSMASRAASEEKRLRILSPRLAIAIGLDPDESYIHEDGAAHSSTDSDSEARLVALNRYKFAQKLERMRRAPKLNYFDQMGGLAMRQVSGSEEHLNEEQLLQRVFDTAERDREGARVIIRRDPSSGRFVSRKVRAHGRGDDGSGAMKPRAKLVPSAPVPAPATPSSYRRLSDMIVSAEELQDHLERLSRLASPVDEDAERRERLTRGTSILLDMQSPAGWA